MTDFLSLEDGLEVMLMSGVECRRTEEEGWWNQTTGELMFQTQDEGENVLSLQTLRPQMHKQYLCHPYSGEMWLGKDRGYLPKKRN